MVTVPQRDGACSMKTYKVTGSGRGIDSFGHPEAFSAFLGPEGRDHCCCHTRYHDKILDQYLTGFPPLVGFAGIVAFLEKPHVISNIN